MSLEIEMEVRWECQQCRTQNSVDFKTVSWNIIRDQCGDVAGMYLSVLCSNCGLHCSSETNFG